MTLLTFRREYTPIRLREALLQFGADPSYRMTLPHAWQHALVDALHSGIRPDAVELTAFSSGAQPSESARLLRALAPLLCERDPLRSVQVRTEALVAHDDGLEHGVRSALEAAGLIIAASDDASTPTIAIIAGAVAPAHCAHLMREDRSFLPLAFELGGVRVGPLVRPGKTPCVACRDLALADEDSEWPMLQAKLIGQRPPQVSVDQTQQAVQAARELLSEPSESVAGRWAIVTNSRRTIWREAAFHESCGCRQP